MADDDGTNAPDGQAPDAGDTAQAGSTATGTAPTGDEVTLLRSRNAGLDAKVTELTKAQKTAERERDEARQKVADYEGKVVGADEALRAQLADKETEVAQARKEAALARIEARYPEAFAEIGEMAFGMTDDKLASLEARLKGVAADEGEPPTPRGNNSPRDGASKARPAREETSADIIARLKTMPLPWSR